MNTLLEISTKQPTFRQTLRELKETGTDFEWYPTGNAVIEKLCARLKELECSGSFLDIGAGDCRVLRAVEKLGQFSRLFLIEKSNTHINNAPAQYSLAGVDFWNVSFISSYYESIYSNPPYSEFGPWAAKIIKETSFASRLFLLLPDRWRNDKEIQEALRLRDVTPQVLMSYDFADAEDRKARAHVELIEIAPIEFNGYKKSDDPFVRFFNENFKYPEIDSNKRGDLEEKIEQKKLVERQNLIEALVSLYEARMTELHDNYKAVCSLPPELLKEFGIEKRGLITSLKEKLGNCKKEYWGRLFKGMENINRTLTTKSKQEVTGMMNAQTGIDFNRENCYAIVMYLIKNANLFYDKQLVDTYKKMLSYANVENYKSNQRVFKQNQFRYSWRNEGDEENTHIKLKTGHRIVMESCGGLRSSDYSWEKGLTESAANFIHDLLVIANNMGFEFIGKPPGQGAWDSSEQVEYLYKDKEDGLITLFTVRAYRNQNMHFKFNPKFIHSLNICAGKLLGWLGSETEAEEEIGVDKETAKKCFDVCFRIGEQQLMLN